MSGGVPPDSRDTPPDPPYIQATRRQAWEPTATPDSGNFAAGGLETLPYKTQMAGNRLRRLSCLGVLRVGNRNSGKISRRAGLSVHDPGHACVALILGIGVPFGRERHEGTETGSPKCTRACSSADKSTGLRNRVSWVRIPPGAPVLPFHRFK